MGCINGTWPDVPGLEGTDEVAELRVGRMARIRKRDDVRQRLPISGIWRMVISQLDFAGYCLQPIRQTRLVVIPECGPRQIQRDLSTVRNGAEEKFADLFPQLFWHILHIEKPVTLDLCFESRRVELTLPAAIQRRLGTDNPALLPSPGHPLRLQHQFQPHLVHLVVG